MDIDSGSFDAKRYVLNMLKQNSIRELVRRNNEIDEEIKIHDHEIQSLVFENYSKFISSIDTVRDMKDNICKVDDKLHVLETSMDRISDLALKIDSTFSVKRKEIQKLDTINKDLEKLRNLCEFPNILQQDIRHYKSLGELKVAAEVDSLFSKSIASYESSYATLLSLKEEPLIAPIYKESTDKVQTIRSSLKGLQAQFNRNKLHSHALRSITKKLLVITDDQVSVLRIYLHSWKQRFSEACFKSDRKKPALNGNEHGKKVMVEVSQSDIPEVNEELWKEFEAQFEFIYEEIYPKLTLSTEQIQLHITNYAKQLFTWGLKHYSEAVPLHCTSLKSFVQVHYMVSRALEGALSYVTRKGDPKIDKELHEKLEDKFESLGNTMMNFVCSRIKLYFIQEVAEVKGVCRQVPHGEESLKQSYLKALNPLKETITVNFKIFIDDMEHFKNMHSLVFKSDEKYPNAVHKQIQTLIKFLGSSVCRSGCVLSEELCQKINPGFSTLNKAQKGLIDQTVRQMANEVESECWFVVAHHFLSGLHNNLGRKIIENVQKNVEIPKNHDYVNTFTYLKNCISRNLQALADHHCLQLRNHLKFEEAIMHIQDFVEGLNIVFSQTRRNIMKKPSFLRDTTTIHETEMLAIKKLPLSEKPVADRNSVLLYFIRKLLKETLFRLRKCKFSTSSAPVTISDLYCLVQMCYEMTNVEEETQIAAFYHLLGRQVSEKVNLEQAQERYQECRRLIRTSLVS